jgi:hypothetical protein
MLRQSMHRCATTCRLDAIQPRFETLLGSVDAVLPVFCWSLTARCALVRNFKHCLKDLLKAESCALVR